MRTPSQVTASKNYISFPSWPGFNLGLFLFIC
nr:MAG TPA: hypothetical protein [Caudoviricetes sp.]DAR52290.1 MAG TPA: hypothetical protein [Caudoviricetes sp.]